MILCFIVVLFFCFKQKTAYEMRISDWSSDVCSSDLVTGTTIPTILSTTGKSKLQTTIPVLAISIGLKPGRRCSPPRIDRARPKFHLAVMPFASVQPRSEEHTSELQSLMRISYAVFCLKKKTNKRQPQTRAHSPDNRRKSNDY